MANQQLLHSESIYCGTSHIVDIRSTQLINCLSIYDYRRSVELTNSDLVFKGKPSS